MSKIIVGVALAIGAPLLMLFLMFKLVGMLPLLPIWRNFFLQPAGLAFAQILHSVDGDIPRAIGLFGFGVGLCFAVMGGLGRIVARPAPTTNDVTSLRSAREKLRLMFGDDAEEFAQYERRLVQSGGWTKQSFQLGMLLRILLVAPFSGLANLLLGTASFVALSRAVPSLTETHLNRTTWDSMILTAIYDLGIVSVVLVAVTSIMMLARSLLLAKPASIWQFPAYKIKYVLAFLGGTGLMQYWLLSDSLLLLGAAMTFAMLVSRIIWTGLIRPPLLRLAGMFPGGTT